MKRWVSFLLAALLSLSLAACGPAAAPQAEMNSELVELTPEEAASAEQTEEEKAEAPEIPDTPPEQGEPEEAKAEQSPPAAQSPPEDQTGEEPSEDARTAPEEEKQEAEQTLPEDGTYTTKEDVALYIHLYGHLPDNFITKKEAERLGWPGGDLEPYAPGKCIGGSRFGNYEELLPTAEGRTYTECDIDTLGAKKRGAKRIVFSNDGLIYYTEDHYKTFELLYGEE